jgi:tetratricopeptide (TPR) repeat protein
LKFTKKIFPFITWAILTLITVRSFGQQNKIDSLITLLKKAKPDTNKVNVLHTLSTLLRNQKPDTSRILAKQALGLSETINFIPGQARSKTGLGLLSDDRGDFSQALSYYSESVALWEKWRPGVVTHDKVIAVNNISNVYYSLGDYAKSMENCLKVIAMAEEIGDKLRIAGALNNIGNIYKDQANYAAALNYYFKGLKIAEELNHKYLLSALLGNIGVMYYSQANYEPALDYYSRALKIREELGDKIEITKVLNNIGIICMEQGNYEKALEYYDKAYKLAEETNNKSELGIILENMGNVFASQSLYPKAHHYFSEALKISKEIGDKLGIAINTGNIGKVYISLKQYPNAEKYLKTSLVLCDCLQVLSYKKDFEKAFSELESVRGNYQSALAHYKAFVAIRDSISSDESTKKQTQLEMRFDFDKKTAADSVRVSEEKKVAAAELKAEKNKSYTLYGGLGIVLVFAGFIYNRFRVTQKQKKIIEMQKLMVEAQKKIVEERNKEVMDSIYYARRIQRSLLPTEKYLKKVLQS